MRITFCGHKDVWNREPVERWLKQVCGELISQGANEFFLGGYGHFDYMCASVLRELKKIHPQIRLILVLPYLNSTMITDGYDETVYPPLETVPPRFAIVRRNEWMVRESDSVVAYVYKQGLQNFQYSYSTAVGMVKSVIGLALVLITNQIVRRRLDMSLL